MNTKDIFISLTKNKVTKPYFDNVYAADTLLIRRRKSKKIFLVVNLDPSWSGGSHWVAMLIKNGKCEYFDSYGRKPPYVEFENMLNNTYIYNKRQLQNNFTTVCGQWCMLYIWERCRGTSMETFINNFSKKDTVLNDHMVNQAVKAIFKTKSKVINKKFLCQQICTSLKSSKCSHYPKKK